MFVTNWPGCGSFVETKQPYDQYLKTTIVILIKQSRKTREDLLKPKIYWKGNNAPLVRVGGRLGTHVGCFPMAFVCR